MLTVLPNEHWEYSISDILIGLRGALSLPHPGSDSDVSLPGLGACLPVRSARVAIVVALRALSLPVNASIGVPLYCCPVVFKAIEAAGCRPRFIDVDPDTYCLSATDLATKSSEVDAVIAVHMFGNVSDMPALRKAAPGKPFIEDCAQALGSRIEGRVVGSFGEMAVFSFRSGKYLSVGEGGAICCNATDLHDQVAEIINRLSVPGRREECIHAVATYVRTLLRTKPLWGLIGKRLWDTYTTATHYTSQAPLRLGRIYETDRNMTVRRLPSLTSWIERQRSYAVHYSQHLAVDEDMLCSEMPGAYYNRFQYPILVPTPRQCDRVATCLRETGISTTRPYRDVAAIAATHYGYTGDCPQSEFVAERVIVIPSHYALTAADVERITTSVNRAWAQARDRQLETIRAVTHTAVVD